MVGFSEAKQALRRLSGHRSSQKDAPKNEVFGYLDSPQDRQHLAGFMYLSGWVVADDPRHLIIEVIVADQVIATTHPSVARPDVLTVHSHVAPANPTPGFRTIVDTKRIPDGIHRLRCVARRDGRATVVGDIEICVDNSAVREARMIDPPSDMSYNNYQLPDAVYLHPAMLGPEERQLAAHVAREACALPGARVELGCYIGGSTVSILDGLRQAGALAGPPGPRLHSYDLFVANQCMVDDYWLGYYGVKAGESFEPVFRSLLGDDARFVAIHPGDVCGETWTSGPISLLYVDCLWSWRANTHVLNHFYRHLVPGSWVLHQDFVYAYYPWLPVSMEWLTQQGYFSYQSYGEYCTVSFRCEKSLANLPELF
jgi:hypothetical protein